MRILISTVLLVIVNYLGAQPWEQKGGDITGEHPGDESGKTVALNDDGTVLAIGSELNADEGWNAGHVRVFEWLDGDWEQKGEDIDGESGANFFGAALDINEDGTIIVAGAPWNSDAGLEAGSVRVFEWDGGDWIQKGDDIDGAAVGDNFGDGVAINDEGNIVVIGAPRNDAAGEEAGHVRVYRWNDGWEQQGEDIEAEDASDFFGYDVAINGDGDRVAIGAPYGGDHGTVVIFEWDGSEWVQKGEELRGETPGGVFGVAVSMNETGDQIITGAPFGTGTGEAYIYSWNGTTWDQKGETLIGGADAEFFGDNVDISDNGNIIAVGDRNDDVGGLNAGAVSCFLWNGESWNPLGDVIPGVTSGDFCGRGVALNGDGSSVALGSVGNSDAGGSAGHTRIFEVANVGIEKSKRSFTGKVYPNPAEEILYIDLGMNQSSQTVLELRDLLGNIIKTEMIVLIKDQTSFSLDLTTLSHGTYFIKVEGVSSTEVHKFVKQ